jgi:3'-phosphoadenosine 5'-phosphosulfate (PAPS) 3'-phosphatase
MSTFYKEELETSIAVAYEAGKIGLKYCVEREKLKTELQIETKSDNTEVTVADKLLNDLITKKLSETFPNYRVIGEESANKISEGEEI